MEQEILNLINKSSNVLIITHVNPDGDTLGSASALKSFVGDKADILIQVEDNFNFPLTYSFLPYLEDALTFASLNAGRKENAGAGGRTDAAENAIREASADSSASMCSSASPKENRAAGCEKYDLVIAVDCASKDRIISPAREIFDNCSNTIVIDHHKTNRGYGKINYIKGGISSTAEVLCDLFEKLNVKITQDMALGLYAGILTDTGCFKYESTTPDTLHRAYELSLTGINTSEIADLCYTNKPKNMILFQSYVISNAKFILNDKIAYTLISKEIQEKFKIKDEYTEGIVETLRSIRGVEAAFVLKETAHGTKVSIRTKEIDATLICAKFNGGGHQRAAGCTIKENLNRACDIIIKHAKEIIER